MTAVIADGRSARINAGLSQADVGTAIGCSHSRVGRFERGEVRNPGLEFVSAYCAVVGLDLALRTYPAGDPVRDRAQIELLGRFRTHMHPSLGWHTEVPLPLDRDLRVWDAVVGGPRWRCRVEAETRVADIQALERRLALKARDDPGGHVVLLLSDTRGNRRTIGLARDGLREFLPLDTRAMLGALREGRDPGGSGIVIL